MLHILCGNIGSGKSTFSRQLAKEGAVIVNDDAIVSMLHGSSTRDYRRELKPLYKSVEDHIIKKAIELGVDVVVDRPCEHAATRARYALLAKSLGAEVVLHVFKFEDPEIHAKRRMDHDPRGRTFENWKRIAEKKAKDFEPPIYKSETEHYLQIVEHN